MTNPIRARRELHGPDRARGIAAVEFVVTVPFLLMLLLAGAEIGRAFVHYQTLSYSVRQAARYVSEHSVNGTTGLVALTATTVTSTKNLAVYGNILGTGRAKLPNYQTSQVQVVNAGGNNVRVVALYPYQPMLGATLPGMFYGGGSNSMAFNMQIAVTLRAIS